MQCGVVCLSGLLGMLLVGCFGELAYEVETNSIHIIEPNYLTGDYNASIGNMGIPLYGASLLGNVFYVSQEKELCKDFDSRYTAKWASSQLPVILLVKRGTCTFLQKALRAQKVGADAVVIYNNVKSERLVAMVAPYNQIEEQENLTIPTAFISKDLGEKIVRSIEIVHKDVVMELDWKPSIFNPDDRVEWEFWYTTNNGCSKTSYACYAQQKFLQSFEQIGKLLDDSQITQFTPHFVYSQCSTNYRSKDYCFAYCIKNGRYCGRDYVSYPFSKTYSSKDVLWQNFRQLCAYQVAKMDDKNAQWWQFAAEFSKQCTMASGNYTDECAEKMLKNADIDVKDVQSCMGDMNDDEDVDLIQAQIDARNGKDNSTRGSVNYLPTLVINEEQYKGRLDNNGVLRAICAGFEQGTEPEMCLSSNLQQDDCTYDQQLCWSQREFSACVDTFRGHICKCPKGFTGDGKTNCQDINECQTESHGCDHECVNTFGGYKCKCRTGYILYGGDSSPGVCIPINPCVFNNGGCEDLCIVKSPGKSVCACAPGLKLKSDNHTCTDINECEEGTHDCQQICHNQDPRESEGIKYSCSCEEKHHFIMDPSNSSACVKTHRFMQTTGLEREAKKSGKAGLIIVIVVVIVVVLVLPVAGYFVYTLIIKKHLHRQVVDVMALYMPLDEERVVNSDNSKGAESSIEVKQIDVSYDENI